MLVSLSISRNKKTISIFLGAIIISELITYIAKFLIGRVRPTGMLVAETGYSFPSNHAVISVVFYGLAAFLFVHMVHKKWQKILISIAAIIIIFLIGLSRIILGVHYGSDVLGGWLLGGVILSCALVVYYRYVKHYKIKI